VLGHALFMKAIHGGKAKNDKIDAHKIAVLLRGGMLPQAYAYPAGMRATRDLLRRRLHLVRKRGQLLAHIPVFFLATSCHSSPCEWGRGYGQVCGGSVNGGERLDIECTFIVYIDVPEVHRAEGATKRPRGLDKFSREGVFDGAHPDGGARAAQARGVDRAAGGGTRDPARAARRRSHRTFPVS
jgi:hypothetical protein